MRNSGYWLRRQIAGCLVMVLAVPFGEAATARLQPGRQVQQPAPVQSTQPQPQNSDTPSGNPVPAPARPEAVPVAPDPVPPQAVDPGQQATPEQQPNGTSNPVGTAAAPYQKTTGAAVSRPAGAVIAPAKQKRTRSFLIRVAVILGAAAAVGTVVGLSLASPSRPQ